MMAILMNNSKANSSRERVQCLFNENVELENKLKKAAQARSPSDPGIWLRMRENFENIILEDHAYSEEHDIERDLWHLHYRRIEKLRALFNAALASAGSAACQNEKSPVRSGSCQNEKSPVRSGSDRLTKLRFQLKTFLSEATGFYHDLMLKIRAKYGLPLGYLSDNPENQIPWSNGGNKSSELEKGLVSCHRCLIYLGDLARYKGLYGDRDSKAREFIAASSYYIQASSLWPSSGNPHNQLAILAGYSSNELVAVYRYFRSLMVDEPFTTARDNLIVAFEKNRQRYTLLHPRMTDKARVKTQTNSSFKDHAMVTSLVSGRAMPNHELFEAFITRLIRLNGILFTSAGLETFDEVFSRVKSNLLVILSSGPDEEFNFGSDAAECRLAIVRMIAILIFTVHNAKKENDNQSYADALQHSLLLQNAYMAAFEFMSCIIERCNQLSNPLSSYLLPGVMVFVEWLACCHNVAAGTELEEKQMKAWSSFWKNYISLLNKLLLSGYSFVNDDEDETCFSSMSNYDEGETANRIALPEDVELRGFLPLLPAHLVLDFSRKHSFGGGVGSKEEVARVQRIVAATKALANSVRIGKEGFYFDLKFKKFVIGNGPQIFDDQLPINSMERVLNDSSLETYEEHQMSSDACSRPEVGVEAYKKDNYEDEDEVIVFKPFPNVKKMDEISSQSTSSEVLASTCEVGVTDFGNKNRSSVGTARMSESSVKHPEILNGLSQLTLNQNGVSLKSELHAGYGFSQPASISVPYPQFLNSRAGHNFSTLISEADVHSKFESIVPSGAAANVLSVKPPSGLQKNRVSRPVRHFGPPPGFRSVSSAAIDKSLFSTSLKKKNDPVLEMNDCSSLDRYQLSSLSRSVGLSDFVNQVRPTLDTVTKSDGLMGPSDFAFLGKQVSQFQKDGQECWLEHHFSEHENVHKVQGQQFQKASQQPIWPPH